MALVLPVEAMGLVPMEEAVKALVPRVVVVMDQVPMVQGRAGCRRSHSLDSDTNCNERYSWTLRTTPCTLSWSNHPLPVCQCHIATLLSLRSRL